MALPISVPYSFANATTSIPLSQLDTDISTIYATVNGIGNGTVALSNVVITGGIISNVSGISTSLIANGTSNVSIATANGSVVVATAGNTAMTVDTSQNTTFVATVAMGSSFKRNILINGNFLVNQRAYVSGTATASGTYMHDRWKSTTTNSNYTFTQGTPDTTITIAAGTIAQIVEDKNVVGGVYTLSWTGTATARIAINGGTTSGAYAASPITTSSATAGQTITVEFSTGTLGKVQLEPGTIATPYERQIYSDQLAQCQRYYQLIQAGSGTSSSGTNCVLSLQPIVAMRTGPSVGQTGGLYVSDFTTDTPQNTLGISTFTSYSNLVIMSLNNFTSLTTYRPYFLRGTNTNAITLSAEL
jgi:hypothetical protein